MNTIRVILALAALSAAGAVQAQTPAPQSGASAMDRHRWQADQHQSAMDRLRLQTDQREHQVRQLNLETQLNRLEIEASRQPNLAAPSPPSLLRSPDDERAARQAATVRRARTAADLGQIDAWLDRRPN